MIKYVGIFQGRKIVANVMYVLLQASTTLTTNDIVINKLTQILSYLRQGKRDKKKKLKEKGWCAFYVILNSRIQAQTENIILVHTLD